jgi:hypothetical protein
MPETSNEVLAERLEGLSHLINEKFNENERSHKMILEQTTKTNGSVANIKEWKNRITGGLAVSNIFIVPVLLWLVYEHLNK